MIAVDRGRTEARPYKGKNNRSDLEDWFGPVFQGVFYLVEELVGDGAVDYAVVVAQGDVAHGADGDGIVDDDGALFDGAEAQDADVGLADDRQTEEATEDTGIGDGEGALLHFFRLEFFGAGAFGEVVEIALDAENILLVGIFDDGNDQSPIERDGHADVDFLVQDDVRAIERRVHGRVRAQTGDRRLHEERHEGVLGLVTLFEFVA